MIAIVDYGIGNLGSILDMLKKIGASAKISADPTDIMVAEKLILSGVDSFDHSMTNLSQQGLIPLLNERGLEDLK